MSQQHALNITLSSNIDLTKFSNKRVIITRTEDGRFHFHSTLRFLRCERHSFVARFLERRAGAYRYLLGNISTPYGYIYEPKAA